MLLFFSVPSYLNIFFFRQYVPIGVHLLHQLLASFVHTDNEIKYKHKKNI